ncbi:MAG: calcium-binding protein, partial [Rhodospirillales bacterium]|nr:calcium-binding protein [Rhodospirillales bacterium]
AATKLALGVATAITGNGGDDIVLLSGGGTFDFSADAGATLNNIGFITGGTGNDIVTVNNALTGSSTLVDLKEGTDSLTLANAINTLSVTNIESITGGTANDTVTSTTAFSSGDTVDLSDGTADTLNLAAGDNTLTVANIENINGNTGADILTATTTFASGDTINLLGGIDKLTLANGGNTLSVANIDTVIGGTGNDVVTETAGFFVGGSTIDLGAGTDSLVLSSLANNILEVANVDSLTGGTGNDTITSSTSFETGDVVNLGAGTADTLILSAGGNTVTVNNTETVTGGTGNDAITIANVTATTTVDGGAGTDTLSLSGLDDIITTLNVELVLGNAGNDIINDGDNSGGSTVTLVGDSGDDSISGGAGSNHYVGNDGNDTLIGDGSERSFLDFDRARYDTDGATEGISVNFSTTATVTGQSGVIDTDTLINIEGVRGTDKDDTFTADGSFLGSLSRDNFNEFEGKDGNDTISGNASTRVTFRTASDSVTADLKDGNSFSTNSGDTANVGLDDIGDVGGVSSLTGSSFDDFLFGSDGFLDQSFESFDGRAGNDVIDGRGGEDRVVYGSATVGVTVDLAGATVTGTGGGTEVGRGFALDGLGGTDTLIGIERINGSKLGDVLIGDSAGNRIRGLTGADTMTGGSGKDRYEYVATTDSGIGSGNRDVITDFSASGSDTDKIFLLGLGSGTFNFVDDPDNLETGGNDAVFTGNGNIEAIETISGNDLIIGVDVDGNGAADFEIELTGVASSDFNVNDFIVRTATQNVTTLGVQTDLLQSGSRVNGTGGADTITLANGTNDIDAISVETIIGGTGNDTIEIISSGGTTSVNGGGGTDTVTLGRALTHTLNVTDVDTVIGLGGGTQTITVIDSSNTTITTGLGNDTITGGGGADVINAGGGDNVVNGSAGNDTISGEQNPDRIEHSPEYFTSLDYQNQTSGITVTLNDTSTAVGSTIGTDTLIAIDEVIGSQAADLLVAGIEYSGTNNTFDGDFGSGIEITGAQGNDIIIGNSHTIIGYDDGNATAAVINLANYDVTTGQTGTATRGAEVDIIKGGVVGVDGGTGGDTITGSTRDELFQGNGGTDTIDGGAGRDLVSFDNETTAVTLDLTSGGGTATGGSTDIVSNIEDILGGSGGDVLTGDAAANRIYGGLGVDTLNGDAGNDVIRGGGGNDTLDGGADTDTVEYIDASAGVTVSLATNTSSGGDGVDTLTNFENLTGSSFDDTLTGDSSANTLDGRQGDNELIGGAGNDTFVNTAFEDVSRQSGDFNTADYSGNSVSQGITVSTSGAQLSVVDGLGDTDTIINIDQIKGSAGADSFTIGSTWTGSLITGFDSSTSNNFIDIQGRGGNDTITGNGFVRVNYGEAQDGVSVNLASGTAFDTDGTDNAGIGNDTISGANGVFGSKFDDTITGSSGADFLLGGAGNDVIDGGSNPTLSVSQQGDRVDYFNSDSGVIVDLSTAANATVGSGTAQDGFGGTDTLINIEDIRGSREFGDILTGDAGINRIRGEGGDDIIRAGAGDDRLRGGAGADILDGGDGNDRVEYFSSAEGVTVNLANSELVSGGNAEGDTLINIEEIAGSAHNDKLTGDSGNNKFDARDGVDVMIGGAGNDTYFDTTLDTTGAGGKFSNSGEDFNIVSYSGSTAGIVANVTSSSGLSVTDGLGGTDFIRNADRINGTSSDDTFTLTDTTTKNWNGSGFGGFDADSKALLSKTNSFIDIRGGGGNDTITGNGVTRINYQDATAGVDVTFSAEGTGTASSDTTTDAGIGTDTFTGVNAVVGSDFADDFNGGAGNQSFRGEGGNDVIDGGAGTDRVDYSNSESSVNVDLGGGTASDGFGGTDSLTNIEDVRGSNDFGDLIEGEAGDNNISGLGGDDLLRGKAGNDTLSGGLGSDFLAGGAGIDTLSGGSDGDIFQYSGVGNSAVGARDIITDFDASSVNEVIFLDGLLTGTFQFGGSFTNDGNSRATATTEGSDTQILIDTLGDGTADMEILLQNVSSGDVDITDFLVT